MVGLECNDCHHAANSHVNGSLDVEFDPDRFPAASYEPGSEPNKGTCRDIGCHSSRSWS